MLLYLDYDGVLHPDGTPAIDEYGRLLNNPVLFCWLPVLVEILRPHPHVQIIVSSDWRRLFDDSALIRLLGPMGARFAGVVENIASNRAIEIAQDAGCRGKKDWLALDDHTSVKAAAQSDRRYIWCPPDAGVTDPHVQVALRSRFV